MSRTEWGVAILIIAGGFVLGGFLGYLFILRPATETAQPVRAIGTPAPTPTATIPSVDTTSRTTSRADAEFLECIEAVVQRISALYDFALEVVATGDQSAARLLASRAFEILTMVDDCREPDDPTLREAKKALRVGLDDILTGGAMLADGNPSGYDCLAEGATTTNRGLVLLTAYMNEILTR